MKIEHRSTIRLESVSSARDLRRMLDGIPSDAAVGQSVTMGDPRDPREPSYPQVSLVFTWETDPDLDEPPVAPPLRNDIVCPGG